eukprot:5006610-Heterocapsa_arctica.AAC.1
MPRMFLRLWAGWWVVCGCLMCSEAIEEADLPHQDQLPNFFSSKKNEMINNLGTFRAELGPGEARGSAEFPHQDHQWNFILSMN